MEWGIIRSHNGASMTETPASIVLREATDRDWGLVRGWLKRPEIQRWWGSLAAAEAELRIAAETPSAIRRVIEIGGVAAGYGQAVDGGLSGDEAQLDLPPGTWDMSLFIAEPALRGQGHGLAALRAMQCEVFGTTFALGLSVVVSVRNEAAVRTYEKAGFRWVRVLDDPLFGASWLMLCNRP